MIVQYLVLCLLCRERLERPELPVLDPAALQPERNSVQPACYPELRLHPQL